MRAALGDRALRPPDAGTVDRDPQPAVGVGRGVNGGLDLVGLGHVRRDEPRAVAQLAREGVALLGVDVGDGHLGALGVQAAAGRLTQSRGAADHEGSGSFDAHGGGS